MSDKVIIYGSYDCGRCITSKAILEELEIPYEYIDAQEHIDTYGPDAEELLARMSFMEPYPLPAIRYKGEWYDLPELKRIFEEKREEA